MKQLFLWLYKDYKRNTYFSYIYSKSGNGPGKKIYLQYQVGKIYYSEKNFFRLITMDHAPGGYLVVSIDDPNPKMQEHMCFIDKFKVLKVVI